MTSSATPTLPKPKLLKLDADVAAVMRSRITCEGNQLVITGERLDALLYKRVNKVLELLGGKWTAGRTQAHVFPSSPKPLIAAALGAGAVENRKQTFQLFETPAELAVRMVALADLQNDHLVLEPSAGRGAIARAILAAHPRCALDLIELDFAHEPELQKVGATNLLFDDFLQTLPEAQFDRILMNPPFSNLQDVDHVRHAYRHLKPSGRLVAIMSTAPFTVLQRKAVEFRKWFCEAHPTVILFEDLPPGTFAESGTDVGARLLVLTKPVNPG